MNAANLHYEADLPASRGLRSGIQSPQFTSGELQLSYHPAYSQANIPNHSYRAVPTNEEDVISSADGCAGDIPLEDTGPPSGSSTHYDSYDSEDKLQPALGNARKDRTTYYIHGQIDQDPVFLEQHLRLLASDPPRYVVNICMQFKSQLAAFNIDMTPYLYDSAKHDWHRVSAVGCYDWVRRGSFLRGRAQDDDAFTNVGDWCRRYCASSCGLKVISVERRIVGWDWKAFTDRLERIVRETGYNGSLELTIQQINTRAEIHNQCHTNFLRTRAKMPFLYYASLIFLLCRLWLFLRTRYWDTIRADWRMSRVVVSEHGGREKEYVSSLSETALCDVLKGQIRRFITKQQAAR